MSVDSVHLSSFYRSVSAWPSTDAEIASVASKVAETVGVPFAALGIADHDERFGIGFSSSGPAGRPLLHHVDDVFAEAVKRHVRSAGGAAGQVKQVHVAGSLPEASLLSVVQLSGDVRTMNGARNGRARRELGWLAVGSVKPLTPKEEILLLASAQRLCELGEVFQLENVIRLRGQFLSIASHELKTPLTSIYGMLQLQERMLKLNRDEQAETKEERQATFLKMVIRQVVRLNELIDGLLDVSRIQSGRFMVEPSEADVSAILREAVTARLEPIATEAGVRLQVEAPERLVAWVDPVRMEEVITNLVMNAIRFSPEGGVVWIRLKSEGDAFRLGVRDQGPAVPAEDRERIFQPFERTQRTSRLGGMGLGLFIARQIAQLHGGNVGLVESVPGKGNLFEAYLPLRNVSGVSVPA